MATNKKIDLFVGVKADQSLRDAVRQVIDNADDSGCELELVPVGRKDWIAGKRAADNISYKHLPALYDDVIKLLLTLESYQRIRRENIKLYSISSPIPVFKDVAHMSAFDGDDDEAAEAPDREPEATAKADAPSTCPICKRTVHPYNLHHNTNGTVVGCFMCGGHAGFGS